MVIISMNNSKLLSHSFNHLQYNSLVVEIADICDGHLFYWVVPENISTPLSEWISRDPHTYVN